MMTRTRAKNLKTKARVRRSIPKLDAVAIGHRIRELRKKRGWRQLDLARATGIDAGVIGLLETGKRTATLRYAICLAVMLRRSLEWICFGRPRNAKLWRLGE